MIGAGRIKLANESESARVVLRSDASAAIALLVAARQILGNHDEWEPESIWLSLGQSGVDLSAVNRAKLQAALALVLVPSFYLEAPPEKRGFAPGASAG
jgi:hypothetical protein